MKYVNNMLLLTLISLNISIADASSGKVSFSGGIVEDSCLLKNEDGILVISCLSGNDKSIDLISLNAIAKQGERLLSNAKLKLEWINKSQGLAQVTIENK
ncbi:hypothetical protein [Aeromonas dhakensis]|uniref:hypothetical protein n=1 Tax=Aeromonas dhakensis TaxID=196024 RepID=UPI003F7A4FE4